MRGGGGGGLLRCERRREGQQQSGPLAVGGEPCEDTYLQTFVTSLPLSLSLHILFLTPPWQISVPRSDDSSDLVKIVGTKEGVDKARHIIQTISDEQVRGGGREDGRGGGGGGSLF